MITSFKDINIDSCKSEVLKQYLTFKHQNPDFIILFQIGEFFETYFEDALIFSKTADLNLTRKKFSCIGEILQAGIPLKSFETHIKKLLDENFKVCLCTQYLDENNQYKRKIERKYTKGTLIEKEFLDSSENNYLVALKLKNNRVYLAYSDISTGQLFFTDFKKKNLETELAKLNPQEILISEDDSDLLSGEITYNTTILNNEKFEKNIDEVIKDYLECVLIDYKVDLTSINKYSADSFLKMDYVTRRCLELTRTRRLLKKKGSLLWFLNYTKTPMGTRRLKKLLDEPLLDVEKIIKRQEAIEEVLNHNDLFLAFDNIFLDFCDLSRITALISNKTIKPKDLLLIAKSSLKLKELDELLKNFKSSYLKINNDEFKNVLNFSNTVLSCLNEESINENKTDNYIKKGYNSTLDYLKLELDELFSKVDDFVDKQRKRLKIDKLKVDYSRSIGYYIELPILKKNLAPDDYLLKSQSTSFIRYTTEELKELEEKIDTLKYKIMELEKEVFFELKKLAHRFIVDIRQVAKNIATIDVVVSFAKCAHLNKLVKPTFNNDGLYVKDGFHPSLLKLKNDLTKNDLNLNNASMIILTGENMSGKSTFLKQNAIISLLAQVGMFVPALSADLSIIDKLFIRQGSTDDIVNNNSTFMVEMNDLKYILDNFSNSSLILLDEPAKSTSAKEGGAIARAFLEYLINHSKAKTIVATHNEELTKIEENYKENAANYYIGSNDNDTLKIDRKIKKGTRTLSNAINTAILADLPKEVIKHAKELMSKENENKKIS